MNNVLSVAFTGHRPDKLPGKYDWKHPKNIAMLFELRNILLTKVLNRGFDKYIFYFGGAIGWDQMSLAVSDKIKRSGIADIELVVAIPFEKQPCKWANKEDIDRYYNQLKIADKVIYVDTLPDYKCDLVPVGEYHPAKMHLRNQYMVDNGKTIIGAWDGTNGGTGNCIKYGIKKNREIIRIDPNQFK